MVVTRQLAICHSLERTRSLKVTFPLMIVIISINIGTCQNENFLSTSRLLNVKCDFERIPGGGCQLRESYCSNHKCICKPDVPINIADRMCVSRHKRVGELCTFSPECQAGSFCESINARNDTFACRCKSGHAYSAKRKRCIKGLKDSECQVNEDCIGANVFCSLTHCDCMVGFQYHLPDEVCHKKSRYNEPCESSINCELHDEFSACDLSSKRCTCGQFLSRKYALDEVTNKCISCPPHRFDNATNSCQPDRRSVDYSKLDRSTMERNSHQYMYIALSMTPFIVFALIGFIYRYVNPNNNSPELVLASEEAGVLTLSSNAPLEYCPTDILTPVIPMHYDSHPDLCILGAQLLPEPPPTYDHASKDLPPPYDEVIGGHFM